MTAPWILYDSLIEDAESITVDIATAAGTSVNNIKDRLPWTVWTGDTPGTFEIEIDLPSGGSRAADAIAVTGHNNAALGFSGFEVFTATVSGGPWTSRGTLSLAAGWSRTKGLSFSNPGAFRYWMLRGTTTSAAGSVGAVMLGRRLDFPEYMVQGFDPASIQLAYRQQRARGGNFVGGIVGHVKQRVALKFGRAGLSRSAFFDPTTLPSWDHFIRTCWSKGRPFWFVWDEANAPTDHFYCFPADNDKSSAPFITSTRRGWTFAFDVLAEGYQA